MFSQEGGVEAVNFDEMTNKLINQSGGGSWGSAFNIVLLAEVLEELVSFRSSQILGKWNTDLLFKG